MLKHMEFSLSDTRMRSRAFKVFGALVVVLLLVAISAFFISNVVATPVSPRELELRGWVSDLRDESLTPSRQSAQSKLEAAGEEAVPLLVTALRANDPILRRNSAEMLGFIASPTATDGLKQALSTDPVPEVRANAAWALGEIKAIPAVNLLEQVSVLDGSAQVRKNALDSLAVIRDHIAQLAGKDPSMVDAIAVTPGTVNTVYVASRRDLLVSRDSGATWTTQARALPGLTLAITANPSNPNILYAGLHSQGMYLSTDGGRTWQSLTRNFSNEAIGLSTVTAIAVDATNPMRVVMAHGIRIGDTGDVFFPLGVLSSKDGGKSWDNVMDLEGQLVTQLAIQNGKVYALTADRVLVAELPN